MKRYLSSLACIGVVLLLPGTRAVIAQVQTPAPIAPTLFKFSGTLLTPTGEVRTGSAVMIASLYAAQNDTAPLWTEVQTVTLDQTGRYSIVVGSTVEGGVPREFFLNGTGRWIGIGVLGEAESPRVMLVTVPYAVKALDADTLGGRTASDILSAASVTGVPKAVVNGTTTDTGSGTGPMTNVTTTTDKLIVNAGGTPSDVGALQLRQAQNNSDGGLFFQDSTLSANIRVWADANNGYIYNGSTGAGPLVFNAGGGPVGIGTNTPVGKLDIGIPFSRFDTTPRTVGMFGRSNEANGYSALVLSQQGGATPDVRRWQFQTVESGAYNLGNLLFQPSGGRVGIGTVAPGYSLDVAGAINTNNKIIISGNGAPSDVGLLQMRQASNTSSSGLFFQDATASTNVRIWADATNGYIFAGSTGAGPLVLNAGGGNVGIGTSSPTSKLDVAGNINVSGNINAKYQDVAEWVDAPVPLESGTVVIIDPSSSNRVIASSKPYDTRIAGAVSAMPGLVLGEKGDQKEMVAQSGRVRVNVDARYGAIKIGDILVTSPTPGHAMKSQPVRIGGVLMHRPGTIIGRALEVCSSGKGQILVLLALQ